MAVAIFDLRDSFSNNGYKRNLSEYTFESKDW